MVASFYISSFIRRVLFVSWVFFAVAAVAQPDQPRDSLAGYLRAFDKDESTKYVAAFHDLNGDGKPEAIVYLVGRKWCGSGGCNTLILIERGNSWRMVSNQTITWPPIRVLSRVTNGWHDIGVWVAGGGVEPGYEVCLRFDGKTYRVAASAESARRSPQKLPGEVVIQSITSALPLHP